VRRFAIPAVAAATVVTLLVVGGPNAFAGAGSGSTVLFERTQPDGLTAALYTMDGSGGNQSLLLADAADGDYSPDGKLIAFDRSTPETAPDIFVMNSNGSDIRQLTDDPAFDVWPDWSPNGKQITFTSDRAGFTDIYVMDADGSNVRRLTEDPGGAEASVFSPNGQQILFLSLRAGVPQIWVMDADGANQRPLTEGPDFEFSWSPNGQQIAFISFRDGTREVYVMDSDGGNQTRLTNDANRDLGPVVFSPNGREVAFMSRRNGNFDIYALALASGQTRQLTTGPEVDGFPEWTNGAPASNS